jgi:hypothetical protein
VAATGEVAAEIAAAPAEGEAAVRSEEEWANSSPTTVFF